MLVRDGWQSGSVGGFSGGYYSGTYSGRNMLETEDKEDIGLVGALQCVGE